MVPGVSRSGASIMGALSLGVERKTAAEFSFFLAVPTMLGATTLELFKNRHGLTADQAGLIAVGFGVSFVVALVVVRAFVGFIGRHGFAPFAWYRIAAGLAALAWLSTRVAGGDLARPARVRRSRDRPAWSAGPESSPPVR